jgi:hypothetical protein
MSDGRNSSGSEQTYCLLHDENGENGEGQRYRQEGQE